jgi:microcystin-dependent protein
MRHDLGRLAVVAAALATAPLTGLAAEVPTGSTGGNAPFSQYQPGLVMSQLVAPFGVYPPHDGGGAVEFLGDVRSFAGTYGAFGAPQALGQLYPINTNLALFSVLGTQFGGNGTSNFALPNLAGRTVVGQGAGPGLTNYVVGQQAGAATTVLTEANLPPHDHTFAGGGVTTTTGAGVPFDNREPSLALTSMIAVNGVFPTPGSPVTHAFIGEIDEFAGNFAPGGFLPADGRLLSISEYAALFAIIGTTYGGDGQTTFALPDLRGRTIVGTGNPPGAMPITLGEALGSESTILTVATMPEHDHTLPGGGVTAETGGSAPFDTIQPSLGMTYLISLGGIYPPHDNGSLPSDQPYFGEVQAFAGDFAPEGWAMADGQLLSIATNQALFSILGTTYGGNGTTNFALPDLRGRSILGSGGSFYVGETVGSDTTTLTVANLAAHIHMAAVPEPAAWALMLVGLGFVGGALRRRGVGVAA